MKVASFNANGIRARLGIILDWLRQESPEILCLQETKVQDKDFPWEEFQAAGYQCAFWGEKSYNGVAMVSKVPLTEVSYGFAEGCRGEDARLMRGTLRNIPIVNAYVPQGVSPDSEKFQFKLDWFRRIRDYFSEYFDPRKPLLWVGDFNVAVEDRDVYDPQALYGSIGFHPDEQRALAEVKKWGFVDVFRKHNAHGGIYTFWDYRVPGAVKRGIGWRIDHIWATECLAEKSVRALVDVSPRLFSKPSDHTFVVAEFDV
ncbi:MAG: exodeoxyribonuclease III [Deltaproteobacteria bacterium]|nr:exodeoxyribonuclease III [Deltaproteobacteria bacterium]